MYVTYMNVNGDVCTYILLWLAVFGTILPQYEYVKHPIHVYNDSYCDNFCRIVRRSIIIIIIIMTIMFNAVVLLFVVQKQDGQPPEPTCEKS